MIFNKYPTCRNVPVLTIYLPLLTCVIWTRQSLLAAFKFLEGKAAYKAKHRTQFAGDEASKRITRSTEELRQFHILP